MFTQEEEFEPRTRVGRSEEDISREKHSREHESTSKYLLSKSFSKK